MRDALRWLTLPFLPLLGAGLVALAGAGVVRWTDAWCPDSSRAGAVCVEAWHTTVVDWTVLVGSVLAALVAVLLPVWAAPSGRRVVAVVALVVTAGGALLLGTAVPFAEFRLPLYLIGGTAILAGGWFFVRHWFFVRPWFFVRQRETTQ